MNSITAKIKVAGIPECLPIPITSETKPQIASEVAAKWQRILDITAEIIGLPAALIMCVHEFEIEVFLSSKTTGNPYHPSERAQLGTGLYCETVMGLRQELLVPDALAAPDWENNPDTALNMISYLGIPILWPDGEIFGTCCVLDKKANSFSDIYRKFIAEFLVLIESDLKSLQLTAHLRNETIYKDLQIREIHHRIKNQFNFLIGSLYLHQAKASPMECSNDDMIEGLESRIRAISSIHEKLYQTANLEEISLGEYLEELGQEIIANHKLREVSFLCDAEEIQAPHKISDACGLILAEWITNSLKHAFTHTSEPQISLSVKRSESGRVEIIYADNGKGMSLNPDRQLTVKSSIGEFLIQQFVTQISAKLSYEGGDGFRVKVEFELPSKRAEYIRPSGFR